MKKTILSALVCALSIPATAQAAEDVTINFGTSNPIPAGNDFQSQLAALGLTRFVTTGASLFLNQDAIITFSFLGSESGFNDTFSTSLLSLTETASFANNFANPVLIGSQFFTAGSLASRLNFTSLGGAAATVGQDGFGIFIGPNQTVGSNFTTFYFGFDDQVTNQDDDHDDFLVRATVSSPVPEPSAWAMLVFGIGLVGSIMRRRNAQTRSFT